MLLSNVPSGMSRTPQSVLELPFAQARFRSSARPMKNRARKIDKDFDPLSINFCRNNLQLVAEEALRVQPTENPPKLIFTANLDHIVQLSKSAEFRRAYASASIITIDGWPVWLAKWIAGRSSIPRVPGADLFGLIAPALVPEKHRLFYVVSDYKTGALLVDFHIRRGFLQEDVGFAVPPLGFECDRAASLELERSIAASRPTHVFFGLGAPKSEVWSANHERCLKGAVVLCCGGALSFFVGTKTRAPRLWRKLQLEWLWRLASEPKRLGRRYLGGAVLFPRIFLRHCVAEFKHIYVWNDRSKYAPTHAYRCALK